MFSGLGIIAEASERKQKSSHHLFHYESTNLKKPRVDALEISIEEHGSILFQILREKRTIMEILRYMFSKDLMSKLLVDAHLNK